MPNVDIFIGSVSLELMIPFQSCSILVLPLLLHQLVPPDYTPTEADVLQGIAQGLKIEGSGTVTWSLSDDNGEELQLTMLACYIPSVG